LPWSFEHLSFNVLRKIARQQMVRELPHTKHANGAEVDDVDASGLYYTQ